MNPRIYIALSTFAKDNLKPLHMLKDKGFIVAINPTGQRLNKQQVIDNVAGFDGVVAGLEPYDGGVINALPQLKCISRCGVGVDNVDLSEAKKRGIAVLNTPDAVVQPVAELTLAMIFDLLRYVTVHTAMMRRHLWERKTGFQIAGKTIGIIGLGRIGRRVAELLRRLDCHVIGFDIRPDAHWAEEYGIALVDMEHVLSSSDVVSIHIVAGHENPFVLGAKEFSKMKKGAFVINTARGNLIDETGLAQALQSGHLAGAGLDVFREEPYTGPLCDLPNVILTPHIATLTHESRLHMETQAVRNIIEHFS